MALSFSFPTTTNPFLKLHTNSLVQYKYNQLQKPNVVTFIKCDSKDSSGEPDTDLTTKRSKLEIGSPIIIIEAPKMIKTAASVPCLRLNSGLVKPGDVGRYFTSSTYLFPFF